MFFLSSALYPLWKMKEASNFIHDICMLNPFTYAVESLRFALYLDVNAEAILIVLACLLVFFVLAIWGYDPKKSMMRRRAAA
jgi:ABC-2 type transport system permease protein